MSYSIQSSKLIFRLDMFTLIQSIFCRLGYPDKAVFYFKEALTLNKNYFPAYRSLHSTYCALVERWHYRMLNDSCRNEAYKEAIFKKVQQGFNTVLDIGTGTGLFWSVSRSRVVLIGP